MRRTSSSRPLRRIASLISAASLAGALVAVAPFELSAESDHGVPDKAALTPSGDITVTTAGTVIDGYEITGRIYIKADNVTIRNSRITENGYYAIRVVSGTGAHIENTDVICLSSKGNGIAFSDYTANNVEVTGCKNAFLGSTNVSVLNSWWNGEPVGNHDAPAPDVGPAPEPTTTSTETTATTQAPPTPTTVALPPTPTSFPTAATTGFNGCGRSLSQLTPMAGTVTLAAGAVLENFDLTGQVTVAGSDAVIRCGRIRTAGLYGVTTDRSSGASYLVEDVQIVGIAETPTASNSAALSPYGDWTARRIDVARFKDGIKLGSNQTITDSWIHNLWKVDGSHNDGMQSVGGRNVKILRNNVEGPWKATTSALILGAGTGGFLDNYRIEGNRLSGGGYTLYIGGKDGNPTPTNIVVKDNTFVRDSPVWGPLSLKLNWPAGDANAVWSGNLFDDGSAFNR